MSKTIRPTDSELDILQYFWSHGPSTVREIHEVIGKKKETGYTTMLKLMQIMVDKGLLMRDTSARSHIYYPLVKEEDAKSTAVGDLLDRLFDGSPRQLVLQALSTKKATQKELSDIRELIDRLEAQQ